MTRLKTDTCSPDNCNPFVIRIRDWDPYSLSLAWETEWTWGLRLYVTGHDPGTKFTIQRQGVVVQQNPIGPLREIVQPPLESPHPTQPHLLKLHSHPVPRPITKTTLPPEKLTTTPLAASGPMLQLVQDVYKFLNASAVSNLTRDCRLCVDSRPLYYVGIAVSASLGNSLSLFQKGSLETLEQQGKCTWGQVPSLTLGDVQGTGWCIHSPDYN